MSILRVLQATVVVLISAIGLLILKPGLFSRATAELLTSGPASGTTYNHVLDKAGVIPRQDLPRFERYMSWIMRESGVDIRFVFLPEIHDRSIEKTATDLMDQLRIGGRTGRERGLLLLYDMKGRRLKIEVGYGLEAWFPDAFVKYLVEDHARMFFSSGDLSLGLRLMLRLLQNRIREAVIGNAFDPRVVAKVQALTHLSGGAGVSTTVGLGDHATDAPKARAPDPSAFQAGSSPIETYHRYLDWLSHWPRSPRVDLFTRGSRRYLASLPVSPAYAEFMLLSEYQKRFKIVERNDLALLYFTSTPFVSPHFFVRHDGHWRMDIQADVRNTREYVGGEYTWGYIGQNDEYTLTFADLLTNIKGCIRISDGDNRVLTIRGRY